METIFSREGVQQGDVLASLLFAVGNQDNYINGLSTSKDVTGLAVIDDFYIEGPYQHVFQPLDRYAGDAKKDGLILRPDKCTALWPHARDPPPPLLD